MSIIGGYFELELNDNATVYHDNAVALNSGRSALEYILLNKKYKKIYLPYYTCSAVLEPILRQKIDYEFYLLDKNFIPKVKSIKNNEALLYTNYFGIMSENVKIVSNMHTNVIIDNSQAFYNKPIKNIPTFYSPRKYFGLPDGGFAYVNGNVEIDMKQDRSSDRTAHLIKRIENGPELSYLEFKNNEAKLSNIPMSKMSILTQKLLKNIDFKQAKMQRNRNFSILHRELKSLNEIAHMINIKTMNCAMVYPFLRSGNKELRNKMIENKIFVASYWPNVREWLGEKRCYETYVQDNLIPIVIDQRYSIEDMNKQIDFIVANI